MRMKRPTQNLIAGALRRTSRVAMTMGIDLGDGRAQYFPKMLTFRRKRIMKTMTFYESHYLSSAFFLRKTRFMSGANSANASTITPTQA
jgi:hypothetical protein